MNLPSEITRGGRYRACSGRVGGFTLLECLVYLAVLGVIFTLAYECFYRAESSVRRLSGNSGDIVRALRAGERWRAELRAAGGVVSMDETGPERILRIPQSQGEVRYVFREGTVWRQSSSQLNWDPVLPKTAASRMLSETRAGVQAWRWELELASSAKTPRIRPMFTFLAPVPHRP